jgi:serine phosphatase RsbU (regulator of sigma subunit)
MRKMKVRLLVRLSLIYTFAALVGTTLLTVNNVFLNHSTLLKLLQFNIPAVLTGNLIILVLLLILSGFWIRRVRNKTDLQMKLTKLPGRMFIGLLLISAAFSCIYHVLQFAFYDKSFTDVSARDIQVLIKNLISEQTIALIIGTLQYALSRRAVRPYVIRLGAKTFVPARSASFVIPMTVASLSCFFITSSAGIEYLIWNPTGEIDLGALAITVGVRFGFAVVVFYLLVVEMRGDLRAVLSSIKALVRGGAAKTHRPIPVVCNDELGRLTESFNGLQERMASAYEEVRQELQLAYNIQQKLLPHTHQLRDSYEIAAVSIPSREVGGDIFDIVEQGDGGVAIMVGDVSGKGMAASMLMTASLALFRKEIRKGGNPGDVLTRLNAQFAGTLQGNLYITMGVGIWEPEKAMWHYASAGHLFPYLRRGEEVQEITVKGALPLGIDADEVYEQVSVNLQAGDQLLLYTDGIVEMEADEGGMFGFERLEDAMRMLPKSADARVQLKELMGRLPPSRGSRSDDDRTMLIVRLTETTKAVRHRHGKPAADLIAGGMSV